MARPWQDIGIQPTKPYAQPSPGESECVSDGSDLIDVIDQYGVSLLDRRREYRLAWDSDRLAWVIAIR